MEADKPLRDVSIIIFDGASTVSTTTDANGNYAFGRLPKGGSYTITPRARKKVTPPTRSFTNLTKDESADFSVRLDFYKISGRVTRNGEPLSGVNILLAGSKSDSTTTGANGTYTFDGLQEGGSYTITPRARMKLTPPTRSFTNLTKDESADFSGLDQPNLYKISGRVTEGASAKPLSGITIFLKGPKSASATTDANGIYAFGGLPEGGPYSITPDRSKMSFTPRDRSIRKLTKDESADFVLAAPECSEAEQNQEDRIIRSNLRRNIQGERGNIIKENVPDRAAETDAVLGEIEFRMTFLIPCKSAAVSVRYEWQVSYYLSLRDDYVHGGQRKKETKTVRRTRTIGCGKILGRWLCR